MTETGKKSARGKSWSKAVLMLGGVVGMMLVRTLPNFRAWGR